MTSSNFTHFTAKQINQGVRNARLVDKFVSKASNIDETVDSYIDSLGYTSSLAYGSYGRPVVSYDINEQFVNNLREASKITGCISLSENIYNVLSTYLTDKEMIELVDKFLTTHSDYLTQKEYKPINLKGD